MISIKIHRTPVRSHSWGTTAAGHAAGRFPKGQITSSPWEGWWHEETHAEPCEKTILLASFVSAESNCWS